MGDEASGYSYDYHHLAAGRSGILCANLIELAQTEYAGRECELEVPHLCAGLDAHLRSGLQLH